MDPAECRPARAVVRARMRPPAAVCIGRLCVDRLQAGSPARRLERLVKGCFRDRERGLITQHQQHPTMPRYCLLGSSPDSSVCTVRVLHCSQPAHL